MTALDREQARTILHDMDSKLASADVLPPDALDALVQEAEEAALDALERAAQEHLLHRTLQGVTAPAPDGTEITTPGEYAAAWNAATPEERQGHLERSRKHAAAAQRCFLEDHGGLLELVTYWRRRAEYAEDILATVQAELRSGPTT